MFKNNKHNFFIVYALNIIIALGYYFDNLDANYSALSSDLKNIIPVAQKFDDPTLFKYDLYVNTLDNVRYYTPFFVQSLRAVGKVTSGDYIQAINIMNTVCHIAFGILWFFLFYKFVPRFWIALLLSILVRGIVWLPGLEIWGIADLWAMMPRTLYITLFPIPFLLLNKNLKGVLLSSFFIGLIFNFHPITGLGGILLFLSFLLLYVFIYKEYTFFKLKTIAFVLFAILVGMVPFVLTYFGKTSSVIDYDMEVYQVAFNDRIPSFFSNPKAFLTSWLKLRTLIYVIPIALYFIVVF